jgi:hypothetical protein
MVNYRIKWYEIIRPLHLQIQVLEQALEQRQAGKRAEGLLFEAKAWKGVSFSAYGGSAILHRQAAMLLGMFLFCRTNFTVTTRRFLVFPSSIRCMLAIAGSHRR